MVADHENCHVGRDGHYKYLSGYFRFRQAIGSRIRRFIEAVQVKRLRGPIASPPDDGDGVVLSSVAGAALNNLIFSSAC